MATETITVYGPGGHDPAKPNNNVISTTQIALPVVESNRRDLLDKAAQALAANATFLAIGAPTNAQIAAQVKLLTRETNALVRLLLGALTDVTDT